MSDAGEKTEKATARKLKKVREEGGLQKSQDLTAWIALAGAGTMLPIVISTGALNTRKQLRQAIGLAENPEVNRALGLLADSLWTVLFILLPMLLTVMLTAVLVNIIQGRGVYPSWKKLKPKFQNLNLIKGLKRVFGMQALWNGAKAMMKTIAVGAVLYFVIVRVLEISSSAGQMSLIDLSNYGWSQMWLLIWASIVAGIVLSFLDALFVFKKNQKQTKMTKHEVKEEYKTTEGDPLIKSARRSRQMAMSRNRMMAAASQADVVVVNPTHYAVALKYEVGKGAPKVVAKGVDHLASRIREIALDHEIPQVQDVALARTLYATVELDKEIPEDLYTAVAQILAFVMMLKKRGLGAGLHKMPQYN